MVIGAGNSLQKGVQVCLLPQLVHWKLHTPGSTIGNLGLALHER